MLSSDEEFILLDSVLPKLKKKRIGVHDINTQRNVFGEYHHLFPELKCHLDRFRVYTRMTPETFEYVNKVEKLQHITDHRCLFLWRFASTIRL